MEDVKFEATSDDGSHNGGSFGCCKEEALETLEAARRLRSPHSDGTVRGDVPFDHGGCLLFDPFQSLSVSLFDGDLCSCVFVRLFLLYY